MRTTRWPGPPPSPFAIFGSAFAGSLLLDDVRPSAGRDPVVGNAASIGMRALLLSGVMIGDGAIIGADAAVASG